MILWLASYPKSGNTLLRSMLSAYFFSEDGKFNFELLKNIKQFPDNSLFKNLGVNIENQKEVVKNYIRAQEEINRRDQKSIRFLKTHSALNDINNYKFTDLKNTLGVIYIVRDPRKIIKSYANHSEISYKEVLDRILNIKTLGGNNDPINKTVIHTGSWSSNYQSWKEFKKIDKYLLIKYEDLTLQPEETFLSVLNFISKITNSKLSINHTKLKNTLETTTFKYVQDLEKKKIFPESTTIKGKPYIKFFRYGNRNDGIDTPSDINNQLLHSLKKEMKELEYI